MKKSSDIVSLYKLDLRESVLFYQLLSLHIKASDWEIANCARSFIKNFDMERNRSGLLLLC